MSPWHNYILIPFLLCIICTTTCVAQGGIHWKDLSVSSSNEGYILNHFTGHVPNGQVCGIIGPSGSGKSTFLKAISGTTLKSSSLDVSGKVWMESNNGTFIDYSVWSGQVAFLQQHDVFFSMLSPRETLELATFLEFPQMSLDERQGIVLKNLEALGLSSVSDNKIGDSSKDGGLSGGERRRLSVALELITTPQLLLADEPTTGLDSTQASKVVHLISNLAKELNIPTLVSLHQPRAAIWKVLDKILVLAPGGKVCYMGDRRTATQYFQDLGYKCPPETNPAEYFIELVSIDTEDPIQSELDLKRIEELANAFALHSHHEEYPKYSLESTSSTQVVATSTTKRPFLLRLRRFGALLRRSGRQNFRNNLVNGLRMSMSLGQAWLLSQIFPTVRNNVPNARSIADRAALLSFSAVNMGMMALTKTVDLFAKEKSVVMRERTRQQYSGFEYLCAKVVAELPLDTLFSAAFAVVLKSCTGLRIPLVQLVGTFSIMTAATASFGFAVGSWIDNDQAAMATALPIMVIYMVVGVINPSGVDKSKPVPTLIRILKNLSPIRWTIEALCVGEFDGMVLEHSRKHRRPWQRLRDLPKMGAFVMVRNGRQILEALGLENVKFDYLITNLAILTVGQLAVSWMGLHYCGGQQFVQANTSNDTTRVKLPKKQKQQNRDTTSTRRTIKVPMVR